MATFGPFTDQDRTAHHESGQTIYEKLLTKGFTDEQIAKVVNHETASREIGVGWLSHTDDDELPALGIVYNGDYKHEEERGSEMIGSALKNFANQDQLLSVEVAEGIAVASLSYSPIREDARHQGVRAAALARHRSPFNSTFHLSRKPVADMRAALKSAKVSPLPRKRDDVELSYLEHVEGRAVKKSVSVGQFQTGDVLVMVTDEPILVAILEALADTAKANALALGSSANPFSRGILLYDVRDVSNELVERTRQADEWHDSKMNLAADAIAKLKESGSLYGIHPSEFSGKVVGRPDSENGGTFYFINYSPRRGDQLFGWMTIEDMYLIADGTLTRDDIDARRDRP